MGEATGADNGPSAPTYGDPKVSNSAVVNLAIVADTGVVTVIPHTIGTADIEVVVTQETGLGAAAADTRFDQTVKIEFVLEVTR